MTDGSAMSDRDRDHALLAVTHALNGEEFDDALAAVDEAAAREFWVILRGIQDVIEDMDGGNADGDRPWE